MYIYLVDDIGQKLSIWSALYGALVLSQKVIEQMILIPVYSV